MGGRALSLSGLSLSLSCLTSVSRSCKLVSGPIFVLCIRSVLVSPPSFLQDPVSCIGPALRSREREGGEVRRKGKRGRWEESSEGGRGEGGANTSFLFSTNIASARLARWTTQPPHPLSFPSLLCLILFFLSYCLLLIPLARVHISSQMRRSSNRLMMTIVLSLLSDVILSIVSFFSPITERLLFESTPFPDDLSYFFLAHIHTHFHLSLFFCPSFSVLPSQ